MVIILPYILPIYQVVEKVLDFADIDVMNSCSLQQKYDFGNIINIDVIDL